MWKQFLRDESGATSIEYALIASGISIVIVLVVNNIGTTLEGTFTKVKTALQ
jgi:pilus assembly protein Flp/PilA